MGFMWRIIRIENNRFLTFQKCSIWMDYFHLFVDSMMVFFFTLIGYLIYCQIPFFFPLFSAELQHCYPFCAYTELAFLRFLFISARFWYCRFVFFNRPDCDIGCLIHWTTIQRITNRIEVCPVGWFGVCLYAVFVSVFRTVALSIDLSVQYVHRNVRT